MTKSDERSKRYHHTQQYSSTKQVVSILGKLRWDLLILDTLHTIKEAYAAIKREIMRWGINFYNE